MIPTLGLVLGSPLLHPEPCQHWVPHAYSIREQMGLRKVSFPVRPAREPSSSGRCQSTSEGFGPGSNLRFSGWWWLRPWATLPPCTQLSMHTSGRALLISPNLLIPVLEFTNTCESGEHSHRVETAPPSRWGSLCLDRLHNLLEKDCEAAEVRSSCPNPCSRHCRAPAWFCCQENRATLLKPIH